MTREEFVRKDSWILAVIRDRCELTQAEKDYLNILIEVLEQQPCEEWCHDCKEYDHDKHCCPRYNKVIRKAVEEMKQPKTGHCKDCKWWKDSDGMYRRGVGAESSCPINRREVFEGNGYCYMYEPQESEEA